MSLARLSYYDNLRSKRGLPLGPTKADLDALRESNPKAHREFIAKSPALSGKQKENWSV